MSDTKRQSDGITSSGSNEGPTSPRNDHVTNYDSAGCTSTNDSVATNDNQVALCSTTNHDVAVVTNDHNHSPDIHQLLRTLQSNSSDDSTRSESDSSVTLFSPQQLQPPPSTTAVQQHVAWSDALYHTCTKQSTLLVTPSQIIQACAPHHVIVPSSSLSSPLFKSPEASSSSSSSVTLPKQMQYMIWKNDPTKSNNDVETQLTVLIDLLRHRLLTESTSLVPTNTTIPSTTGSTTGSKSTKDKSNWYTSYASPILSVWNRIITYDATNDDSDYVIPPHSINYPPSRNNNNDEEDDYYAILSKQRQQQHGGVTTTPSKSIFTSPSKLFSTLTGSYDSSKENDIPSASLYTTPTTSTTTLFDAQHPTLFLSIDLMMDCIRYIQEQLQNRQKRQYTNGTDTTLQNDDTSNVSDATTETTITSIVSVHTIRKQWFSLPSSIAEKDQNQHHDHPTTKQTKDEITAKLVSESLSDEHFDWLLSVICQPVSLPPSVSNGTGNSNTTTTTTTSDNPIALLQRLDRDQYSGNSVYILHVPSNNNSSSSLDHTVSNHDDMGSVETRLTLYDLQQNIHKLQTNIDAWRRQMDNGTSRIDSQNQNQQYRPNSSTRAKQKLKVLQRQRMYEQHIENAQATMLNLESIQLSIFHTLDVSRPTIALLHQAKDVLQTIRKSQPDPQDVLEDLETMNEELLLDEMNQLSFMEHTTVNNDNDNDNDMADLEFRLQQLMTNTETQQETVATVKTGDKNQCIA
jgi:hypothetical protein